MADEKLKINY